MSYTIEDKIIDNLDLIINDKPIGRIKPLLGIRTFLSFILKFQNEEARSRTIADLKKYGLDDDLCITDAKNEVEAVLQSDFEDDFKMKGNTKFGKIEITGSKTGYYLELNDDDCIWGEKAPIGRFIPDCKIGNRFLTAAIVDKYLFGTPLNLTARRLKICGFNISTKELCTWVNKVAEAIHPLYRLINGHVFSSKILRIQDTPLTGYNIKEGIDKCDMVLSSITSDDYKAVYIDYKATIRQSDYNKFFKTYDGIVLTDHTFRPKISYKYLRPGYLKTLFNGINELMSYSEDSLEHATIRKISRCIDKLCQIDATYREQLEKKQITEKDFLDKRNTESSEVFEKLHDWCVGRLEMHEKEVVLYEPIKQYLQEERAYKAYLDYAKLSPSLTESQRIIDTLNTFYTPSIECEDNPSVFDANVFDSILKTAIINNLDPYSYMEFLIKKATEYRYLPQALQEYDSLLPWRLGCNLPKPKNLSL